MSEENLLQETKEALLKHGKDTTQVSCVICGDQLTYWPGFARLASDLNYDSGYGGQRINSDLKIIFTDGSWLERAEYDGSEWWEFKSTPKRPKNPRPMTDLHAE